MTIRTIVPPSIEPVSLAQAKTQLRVDHAHEDALIEMLIRAAREQAEHRTGRALITRTVELSLDAFPAGPIDLQMPIAQSIVSVSYVDAAGNVQVLDPLEYSLDAHTLPAGWLHPSAALGPWPATARTANAVRIEFVTGYGAAPESVPAPIRMWILSRVGTMYKFREELAAGLSVSDIPAIYADGLLADFRVLRL